MLLSFAILKHTRVLDDGSLASLCLGFRGLDHCASHDAHPGFPFAQPYTPTHPQDLLGVDLTEQFIITTLNVPIAPTKGKQTRAMCTYYLNCPKTGLLEKADYFEGIKVRNAYRSRSKVTFMLKCYQLMLGVPAR